jgi:predicted nucleic acid-binding protein
MTPVFADTFYFIALVSPDDAGHAQAEEWAALVDRLVTTEWVLLELADGLSDTENRSLFATIRSGLHANPLVEVIPLDMGLQERAVQLYGQRADKEWSLTDCVSFLVMRDRGLTEVLTGDHHFEQAGFVALLK